MTDSTSTPMLDRYQRAQALYHSQFNKSLVFNTTLFPHWIEDTDCFWYRCGLDNSGGAEYRLVDAKAGTQKAAFGHQALAKALEQASGETVDPRSLPLTDLQFSPCYNTLTFRAFDQCWQFDDRTATLLKAANDFTVVASIPRWQARRFLSRPQFMAGGSRYGRRAGAQHRRQCPLYLRRHRHRLRP